MKKKSAYFTGERDRDQERKDEASWGNCSTGEAAAEQYFKNQAKKGGEMWAEKGEKWLDEYNARCASLGINPISRPPSENVQLLSGHECDVCGEEGSKKKCGKCLSRWYCSRESPSRCNASLLSFCGGFVVKTFSVLTSGTCLSSPAESVRFKIGRRAGTRIIVRIWWLTASAQAPRWSQQWLTNR
eukprot:6124049-Pyramimonas_sp.AAC.1